MPKLRRCQNIEIIECTFLNCKNKGIEGSSSCYLCEKKNETQAVKMKIEKVKFSVK